MVAYAIGSLVRARGREWVVLPSDDEEVLRLRPLGGTEAEATGLYLPLEGGEIQPAVLAPPDPAHAGDFASARLLRDAVRLGFRSGAGPLRCLARIAVEPRPYQLVPLLMALRLDPVRLLIGDDVGIGKTIEAALIARELLDRGEIVRLCVLCPPHLCEQWAEELETKFHLPAAVVRAGSVARLERDLPLSRSLFEEYPIVVVSIDYIKSDRRRADFVRACPECVIVDEGHTCALPGARAGAQHQRHALVAELAADPGRHLILTTATPHSGDEQAFASLVAMLDADLGRRLQQNGGDLDAEGRQRLARYFIQRRRADIRRFLERDTAFPERVTKEETYRLAPAYRHLLEGVLDYAGEVVTTAQGLSPFHRRLRWWAALALLRCASSSPAAAAAALRTRMARPDHDDVASLDRLAQGSVFDEEARDEAVQDDSVPGADVVEGEDETAAERKRLLRLAAEADGLKGEADPKLAGAEKIVADLLAEGFSPIVFCRYIATAAYVAEALGARLRGVSVEAVTGELPPEERAERVAALGAHSKRVLVATDCLSEGINLQQHFDAVLHYDLSWNPTRHEQREGRVDRFGQARTQVRTVMFYGQDNRVDGAVLEVLLRKAERIRKALGVSVPLPMNTNAILEAIFDELFRRRDTPEQLAFDFGASRELEATWNAVAEREKRSRTIFAQQSLRPEEVAADLARANAAVGGATEVARLVAEATAPLDAPAVRQNGHWEVDLSRLPAAVTDRAGFAEEARGKVRVAFEMPVPHGVTYVARTHPLVEALSGYIVDTALETPDKAAARRCGAVRTDAVAERTLLLLLRARYRIHERREGAQRELLAEEALFAGLRGDWEDPRWLDQAEVERLAESLPGGNVPLAQAQLWLRQALAALPALAPGLEALGRARAEALLAEHRRVRAAANLRGVRYAVEPHLPLDVLGLYILMPGPATGPRREGR